jgi:pimeloyl-ACP methyl ester carboxylesterase
MFGVSAWPVCCTLISAAVLAGCSAPPPGEQPAGSSAPAPQLSAWEPCPPGDPTADGLECATIRVPQDYTEPDGETFTIPVSRIPSKADKPQLLMMNPGGPGISGVGDLRSGRDYYAKFTDVYTVVSFDPRGMGGSTPTASCLDDQQKAAIFDQPSVPRSEADGRRRQELAAGIGASCQRELGSALGHLGTGNVVRDMDAIRAAMGFDKTSYLGYSYGTFVGALYTQTFPERTGRVVLDSVMAPQLDYRAIRHDQAKGMQASVLAFVEDCLRRTDCPLPGPPPKAMQTIVDIIGRLDTTPYRATDGRELSGSRILALVESSQYMPRSGWPALREVLGDALTNSWPAVVEAAYSPDLMVNPADSEYLAVVCTDFATERDPQAPARLAPTWAQESPISGGNRAWSLAPCESWPVGPVRRPGPVNPEGAGPVLILNTTGDPATPLEWAQSLHRQISGSSLVIAPGPGHLASSQNTCADEMLAAFLLEGTPPPEPVFTCPVNP